MLREENSDHRAEHRQPEQPLATALFAGALDDRPGRATERLGSVAHHVTVIAANHSRSVRACTCPAGKSGSLASTAKLGQLSMPAF